MNVASVLVLVWRKRGIIKSKVEGEESRLEFKRRMRYIKVREAYSRRGNFILFFFLFLSGALSVPLSYYNNQHCSPRLFSVGRWLYSFSSSSPT